MTHQEYAALGWWAQRRAIKLAIRWQASARDWRIMGEHERAARAQWLADYYAWPFWKRFVYAHRADTVMKARHEG